MQKDILDKIEKTIKYMPAIEMISLSRKDFFDLLKDLEKQHRNIYGSLGTVPYQGDEFIYKGVRIKRV